MYLRRNRLNRIRQAFDSGGNVKSAFDEATKARDPEAMAGLMAGAGLFAPEEVIRAEAAVVGRLDDALVALEGVDYNDRQATSAALGRAYERVGAEPLKELRVAMRQDLPRVVAAVPPSAEMETTGGLDDDLHGVRQDMASAFGVGAPTVRIVPTGVAALSRLAKSGDSTEDSTVHDFAPVTSRSSREGFA